MMLQFSTYKMLKLQFSTFKTITSEANMTIYIYIYYTGGLKVQETFAGVLS